MKKIKLIKKRKLLVYIIFALIILSGSIYGINNYKNVLANDIKYEKKRIANLSDDNKPNGTYKLSLDVTGAADTTKITTKANVLVVYDVSGSMIGNNSHTHIAYEKGKYGLHDGTYIDLYTDSSCTKQISDNNTSGVVYYITENEGNNKCHEYTKKRYAEVERGAAAEKTVYDFANALFKYNKETEDDNVEMALITFSGPTSLSTNGGVPNDSDATLVQGWTKNKNDILNKLSSTGLTTNLKKADGSTAYGGGTDWETAMRQVVSFLNSKDSHGNYVTDSDPTYIIFVTDGAPTFRRTRMTGSNYNDYGYGNTTRNGVAINDEIYNYRATIDEVKTIGTYDTITHTAKDNNENSNTSLYGIYAYGKESDFLDDLIYAANNNGIERTNPNPDTVTTDYYYHAEDTESLNQAISDIFKSIVNTLGVGDVSITDGTTDQIIVSSGKITAGMLDVDSDSFEYWLTFPVSNSTSPYKATRKDLVTGEEYTINFEKESEDKYTATWTDSSGSHTVSNIEVKEVKDGKLTYKWTESNDLYKFPAGITFDDIKATYESGSVKWNLTKLKTLLDGVTYTVTFDVWPSQATMDLIADLKNGIIKRGDTEYPDSTAENPHLIDPMVWQYLDENYGIKTNTKAAITYNDTRNNDGPKTENYNELTAIPTNSSKELAIAKEWHNEIDERTKSDITLGINRDDEENVYSIELNKDNNWGTCKDKCPDNNANVTISVGIMTIKNGIVRMNTPGHDYSFAEDTGLTYHWELKAPTLHPMQINGTVKMLVLLEETEIPATLKSIESANAEYTQGVNTYYKLTFDNKETKYYKVDDSLSSLTAKNERRSTLTISKSIIGDNYQEDSLFDFNIIINNKENEDIWFSARDAEGNPIFNLDTNATKENPQELNINDEKVIYKVGREPIVGEIFNYTYDGVEYQVLILTDEGNGKYTYDSGTYHHANSIPITVRLQKDWNIRIINLPTGTTYNITENTNTPEDGYILNAIKDQNGNSLINGNTYTIEKANSQYQVNYINEYVKTKVSVTKKWVDDNNRDNLRDALAITLTGKLDDGTTVVTKTKEFTKDLVEADEFTYTFEDLDVYHGTDKIIYTVSETTIPNNYQASTPTGNAKDGFIIINTHTPETITISGKKVWNDSNNLEGYRPEKITIRLKADNELIDDKVIELTSDAANADGDWEYSFVGLPKYRAHGNEIIYSVSEDTVANYTTYYKDIDEENDKEEKYIIINEHIPSKTAITVTKEWLTESSEGIKDPYEHSKEIKVNLEGRVGETLYYQDSVILKEKLDGTEEINNKYGENWTYTFENLPEYREGTLISYTINEDTNTPEYNTTIENKDEENSNEIIIKNTYNPGKTTISGTKVWLDEDNQDGIRPDSIKINLLADGILFDTRNVTADDNWNYVFDNLPKQHNGKDIVYTVTEEDIEGYQFAVDPITDDNENITGYTVTNSHTPETISFNVYKIWSDNDNNARKRPETITVRLLANDIEVDSTTISAKDNWHYEFIDKPKYHNGQKITYTVIEDEVKNYTTEVTKPTESSDGYAVNIMNTYEYEEEPPQTGIHHINVKRNVIVSLIIMSISIIGINIKIFKIN